MVNHNHHRGLSRDLGPGAVSENNKADDHHSDNSSSRGQRDGTTPINSIARDIHEPPDLVQNASLQQFQELRNEVVGQLQAVQRDLSKTQSQLIKAIAEIQIMRETQAESDSWISLMAKEIAELRRLLVQQERFKLEEMISSIRPSNIKTLVEGSVKWEPGKR